MLLIKVSDFLPKKRRGFFVKNNDHQELFGFLLTPLIDILLFMIIALMVLYYKNISPLNAHIVLPQTSSQSLMPTQQKDFVVGVNAQGEIYIQGKHYSQEDFLKILQIQDKSQPLFVQGDATTSYSHIIFILDAAKKANFSKIYLLSKKM